MLVSRRELASRKVVAEEYSVAALEAFVKEPRGSGDGKR